MSDWKAFIEVLLGEISKVVSTDRAYLLRRMQVSLMKDLEASEDDVYHAIVIAEYFGIPIPQVRALKESFEQHGRLSLNVYPLMDRTGRLVGIFVEDVTQ